MARWPFVAIETQGNATSNFLENSPESKGLRNQKETLGEKQCE